MRRFATLFTLLLSSIPFGVSISGCSHNLAPVYCNGGDSGPTTAQASTITLQPVLTGISLNYAEIGQVSTPTATDCKGTSVSVIAYTYGSTDMTIADVEPSNGRLCAGTWNRNTAGGIPDFTYCVPTNKTGTAYISASVNGVTSNPIPIYVHPSVTSVVLGSPSTNCTTDPSTNCCPLSTGQTVTASPYNVGSCLSQGLTAQLVARVYAGDPSIQANNISCQVGHLQYTVSGATSTVSQSPVVSIDQNGVATANQPGSVLISANVANAASSAGYFSTCPPASITLSAPNATAQGIPTDPVVVNENNTQSILATVVDTKGVTLTGLSLEYVSTSPRTIPAGSGSVTPPYAGSAAITAICQPATCNPAPYNQIGLFGNGKPITSNAVSFTTPGTNSTVLYMASTQSQYIVQDDFTTSVVSAPFLLPYIPNSMVMTNDGSTIYLGSSQGLMVLTSVNSLMLSRTDITTTGSVLAVSPDGNTVVLSDPVHQMTTLQNSSGSVISTYGGVGTHAAFSPDSQTIYITAGNQLLIYSSYIGWTSIPNLATPATDVAVTVPSVGAFFAGPTTTARGYCASSTATTVAGSTTEANNFFPLDIGPLSALNTQTVATDRVAATNDGKHLLGATASPAVLKDLSLTSTPIGSCPTGNQTTNSSGVTTGTTGGLSFPSTLLPATPLALTASAITGIIPTPDSSVAFITYKGSGGVLPAYAPAASGSGTTTLIKLSGTATAPTVGVLSEDGKTFYTGTTGDNLVHVITRSTLTDSSTLAPNLTTPAGTVVPVDLMAQKPRRTT